MNEQPKPFNIVFTRHVFFRDRTGEITHHYTPGETIKATGATDHYFITTVGGIYFNEAKRV